MDTPNTHIQMVDHIAFQVIVHHLRIDGRIRAAALLECALEQGTWRNEHTQRQMTLHFRRKCDSRTAARLVRARPADLLNFAKRVVVRKQIALGQVSFVDGAAGILVSGKATRTLVICTIVSKVFRLNTYFNQEVMHFLQKRWPHDVKTGS